MKTFITFSVLFILISGNMAAQTNNDTEKALTIYDVDGFVNSDENGLFHYIISLKSKDSLFTSDGYKFIIDNRLGFDKYADLKGIGEEVSLDSVKYLDISELSKFTNCELHNFLSLQTKIFVIFKPKDKAQFYKYPIIYTGTQKNIEMLKN
ncbi:hypothetical protein MKO06_16340 [Gramella sp. GC03-9]|uniref:Uncharacterized protein n=1 Tax=Christiangramia oceanisediminis TaxID=2920386 RepID=A0A9X2L063_9FLAO|nr:hypothetical protein [Gramella oceanisediminis]MCP9201480.1 hypothetical protein [Gramella oceanisediminis]